MSVTIKDLNRGLNEITQNKRKREVAVARFTNATENEGKSSYRAAREALKAASSDMAGPKAKYDAAIKSAGATPTDQRKASAQSVSKRLPRVKVTMPASSKRPKKATKAEYWSQGTMGKLLLALLGLAIAIVILSATWSPWVFEKYGENLIFAISVTLLYGAVLLSAGLTGGLWMADVLYARHQKASFKEKANHSGVKALKSPRTTRP